MTASSVQLTDRIFPKVNKYFFLDVCCQKTNKQQKKHNFPKHSVMLPLTIKFINMFNVSHTE